MKSCVVLERLTENFQNFSEAVFPVIAVILPSSCFVNVQIKHASECLGVLYIWCDILSSRYVVGCNFNRYVIPWLIPASFPEIKYEFVLKNLFQRCNCFLQLFCALNRRHSSTLES
jgi:hypothetical protein